MSRFIPINLKPFCNHKMVYTKLPKEKAGQEFGLDNICILRSDVKLKEHDILDGVEFCFDFGKLDNVICTSQKITVNALATTIHFIGFAYWGDVNEYIKITYDDLSEEIVRVPFIDWAHMAHSEPWSTEWYGENISTVRTVITSGALTHLAYFHHITCEIGQQKNIKEILLPDNMFTHIFAITLEDKPIEKL